jgi:hypothetical protein
LKKTFIFSGTLDSLGYKYSGEGGVIGVSKGSLVVMKGNKVDDLYFFQGSTMSSLHVVSSFEDPDSDTTWSRHMRWDGMTILS